MAEVVKIHGSNRCNLYKCDTSAVVVGRGLQEQKGLTLNHGYFVNEDKEGGVRGPSAVE